jgi:hypothetical protein
MTLRIDDEDAPTTLPEWGVLLKVEVRDPGPEPSDEALQRVLDALPGADKRLTGGRADFTVWSWFEAADAPAAVQLATGRLRAAAANEGFHDLRVIRAHAASVEGRSSPFRAVAERLGRPGEWSIYFRAAAPPGRSPVDSTTLERIEAALGRPDTSVSMGGDREKFLLDDGTGLVVRFWVDGASSPDAFLAARTSVRMALAEVGLGDWTLVRMQAATAEARHGDTFPGIAARQPRQTEETR